MKCLKLTRWKSAGAGIVVGLTLISCGDANRTVEPVTLNDSEARSVEMQPLEVLNLIHKANLKEIKLGNLAKEKATKAEVKQFAEQIVADHESVDAKVKETATGLALKLEEFDAGADSAIEKLSALEGEAFDKALLEAMATEHETLITQLEGAKIGDEKVQGLVTELLPSLKAHQAEVKKLLGTEATEPERSTSDDAGASGSAPTTDRAPASGSAPTTDRAPASGSAPTTDRAPASGSAPASDDATMKDAGKGQKQQRQGQEKQAQELGAKKKPQQEQGQRQGQRSQGRQEIKQ